MNHLCLGCTIRELRDASGLTVGDFANRAEVSVELVSSWERGSDIEVHHLPLIAQCLEVSIDQLFVAKNCAVLTVNEFAPCRAEKQRLRKITDMLEANKMHREYCGDNVFCPCCNRSFSRFKKFIFHKDEHNPKFSSASKLDVVCPFCNSMPRHRIISTILQEFEFDFSNVLLLAPNKGLKTWFRRKHIKYLTGDLFDRYVDLRIDVQKTLLDDESFSFISCDHVLEHVPNWHMALSELYRITSAGGHLEITVPLLPEYNTTLEDESLTTAIDRREVYGQYDHLRIFGSDFRIKLEDAGFEVAIFDGDTFDARIQPFIAPAIYDYNKIFICRKPS